MNLYKRPKLHRTIPTFMLNNNTEKVIYRLIFDQIVIGIVDENYRF